MNSKVPSSPTYNRRNLLGLAAGGLALGACASTRATAGSSAASTPATSSAGDAEAALRAQLQDQSGLHQAIQPSEKSARLERLSRILREHEMDAFLVESGSTLRYLTDVGWGQSERLFALIVMANGEHFWICPHFEAPRAEKRIAQHGPHGPIVRWHEHEYAWKPLADALGARGAKRIAIEPRARAFVAQSLAAEMGHANVLLGTVVLGALRGVKDAHELRLLRAANELTQRAISAASREIRVGMTDHEIGGLIRTAQASLGLKGVWILPLIAEGAAYPHGAPEGRKLKRGDTILVDTGGALHGYQSDISRTWCFGRPASGKMLRAWRAVRKAQQAAFEHIRPGVRCAEVDGVARSVIEAEGFGTGYTTFAHRLGHGIGMDGHEEPYFDGGSQVVLQPGMTFSDEPGIYIEGEIGIRLEDIVAVTEEGAEHFGGWQLSPDSPDSGGA